MERLIIGVIKLAMMTMLATGGGIAAKHMIMHAQREAKGAMSMGISYGKFNRRLLNGP
jgi:hypothetical protein